LIIENLSTLKINKLTQEQYNREFLAGNIDENALYLTPDDGDSNIKYVTQAEYDALGDKVNTDGILYVITDSVIDSNDIFYDNSTSGLNSNNIQSAVDEVYQHFSDEFSKFSIDLLWENPDPTVSFAAQEVSVSNMSLYAFIMIVYKYRCSNAQLLSQTVPSGNSVWLSFSAKSSGSFGRRPVAYVDDNTLSFETASNSGSDNNEYAVPYQIYGIKTSINNLTLNV